MENPIYKAIEYAYKKNDDGFTFGCYIYDAERHWKRINPRSFPHLDLEDRISEKTKQLIVKEALRPMNFPSNWPPLHVVSPVLSGSWHVSSWPRGSTCQCAARVVPPYP